MEKKWLTLFSHIWERNLFVFSNKQILSTQFIIGSIAFELLTGGLSN